MSDEWDVPQDYFLEPHAHNTMGEFPHESPIRRMLEQGWSYQERLPGSWLRTFSRLPAPASPVTPFDPMVTRPRTIIHQFSSSPTFPGTQSSTGHLGSQLTADEQVAVLKKLRKDIYNSSPRRFSRMISTYYRNQSSAHTRLDARDDDADSKRCAVCLEDFESGEEVTITPCNHMFHENCIVPWVKDHGKCPVCRFSLYERETPQSQASQAPEMVYQHWETLLFVPHQRF